ncbi:MAG: diguanylate cyclase [Defluviitaleaceae bacterium]|nr:diguanylate cyclase [Defluviitaleaceae bacterium]
MQTMDSLTGLNDRRFAELEIIKALKKKELLHVAIFDLDHFANIEDKIGRDNCDATLREIGAFLKRSGLSCARYGGDEFIIILKTNNRDEVRQILDELRAQFRKHRFINVPQYDKVRLTYSMGVASSGANIKGSFQLLKTAESALFEAKKNGRNRIRYANGQRIRMLRHGSKKSKAGECTTVIGRSLKGDGHDGADAYFSSISEPYGVVYCGGNKWLFADRSNHQIKQIRDNRIYTTVGRDAGLCKPSGVAVGPDGGIYIADTGNHRLVKAERGGLVTVAGDGRRGYDGDGGPAVSAAFNRPGGIAVDKHGNIYTNDYGNNVIRMIDRLGTVRTIAGSGSFGYTGDGGSAAEASLDRPYGLCVSQDGKWLYIADYGNHCIRSVDIFNGVITTLCGTGEQGYAGDGGLCWEALLNCPYWVCLGPGSLFIADAGNHCIRRIDLSSKIISTLAGNGKPGYIDSRDSLSQAQLNLPAGMDVNGSEMLIADYGNNAIRMAVF